MYMRADTVDSRHATANEQDVVVNMAPTARGRYGRRQWSFQTVVSTRSTP